MNKTLMVGGREFSVEQVGDEYVLRGARGATYKTDRTDRRPEIMFVYSARTGAPAFDGLALTDENGALEVF